VIVDVGEGVYVRVMVAVGIGLVALGVAVEGAGVFEEPHADKTSMLIMKIKAFILFMSFSFFFYPYQNLDVNPACLKISATCSVLRP
jgi:hypothetical protein